MQEQKVLEYESRMSLIKWDVFSMTFYQLEGTCDAGK